MTKFELSNDKSFQPVWIELKKFREQVEKNKHHKLSIAVERNSGYTAVYSLDVYDCDEKNAQNYRLIERLVKALLWAAGGYKIYVCGSFRIYELLRMDYSLAGKRRFDAEFMSHVYGMPFEVCYVSEKNFPEEKSCSLKVGGHVDGRRIGFDAGGSDIKICAVDNGKLVFSKEIIWQPKQAENYSYHYQFIKNSILKAAEYLPEADALGISSAGVYVDNKIMVSSLFMSVGNARKLVRVRNMYIDIAKELNLPVEVANDGDVAALSGAIGLNAGNVLGIAMGTSEAGGYVNKEGSLTGYLSELAFVPIDLSERAARDEWSGDIGCGVKYLSQDGVIKLAEIAGIKLESGLTAYEKLVAVQKLAEENNEAALSIFRDLGIYLGYAVCLYAEFYNVDYLLVLGRVTTGKGGNVIVETCNNVLKAELPEKDIKLILPDEKMRRVGQAVAAASLKGI